MPACADMTYDECSVASPEATKGRPHRSEDAKEEKKRTGVCFTMRASCFFKASSFEAQASILATTTTNEFNYQDLPCSSLSPSVSQREEGVAEDGEAGGRPNE